MQRTGRTDIVLLHPSYLRFVWVMRHNTYPGVDMATDITSGLPLPRMQKYPKTELHTLHAEDENSRKDQHRRHGQTVLYYGGSRSKFSTSYHRNRRTTYSTQHIFAWIPRKKAGNLAGPHWLLWNPFTPWGSTMGLVYERNTTPRKITSVEPRSCPGASVLQGSDLRR